MIELRDVSVVRSGRPILNRLSFSLESGQHTAILGPNGCGKSTLLRLLAREIYPFAGQGRVSWFGRSDWSQSELRQQIGFIQPIAADTLLEDFTVLEMVISGAFGTIGVTAYSDVTAAIVEQARELLHHLSAEALVERTYSTLSAGEVQRVLIARSLMPSPRVLVLDEPTANLDFVARGHFLTDLERIASRTEAVLLVTHHFEELIPLFGRIVLMNSGRVVKDGPRALVVNEANIAEAFEADPAEVQALTLTSFQLSHAHN